MPEARSQKDVSPGRDTKKQKEKGDIHTKKNSERARRSEPFPGKTFTGTRRSQDASKPSPLRGRPSAKTSASRDRAPGAALGGGALLPAGNMLLLPAEPGCLSLQITPSSPLARRFALRSSFKLPCLYQTHSINTQKPLKKDVTNQKHSKTAQSHSQATRKAIYAGRPNSAGGPQALRTAATHYGRLRTAK